MDDIRDITTVEEVESIREAIEEFAADLWDTDPDTGRVDWESWVERFERQHDLSLPDQWDDPVIRKVKRIAKQAINEAIGG
jgi:hypothetical protein